MGLSSVGAEENLRTRNPVCKLKGAEASNEPKRHRSVKHETQQEVLSLLSYKAKKDCLCGLTMGTPSTVPGKEGGVSALTLALSEAHVLRNFLVIAA